MSITTISSREFNQNSGGAKKRATQGPVIITDRGKPSHVMLSFDEYRTLTGKGKSLLEMVSQKEPDVTDDFEFDPTRMNLILREVDFD